MTHDRHDTLSKIFVCRTLGQFLGTIHLFQLAKWLPSDTSNGLNLLPSISTTTLDSEASNFRHLIFEIHLIHNFQAAKGEI